MHGDEVQVSLVSAKGKTPLANVRFVLTRATQAFLGIYHDAGPLGAVVPLDSRIQRDFFVLPEDPSVGRHYVFEGDVQQKDLREAQRNLAGCDYPAAPQRQVDQRRGRCPKTSE